MNLIQFAQPLFVEYLDVFQFGAVMNKAAVIISKQVFCVTPQFHFSWLNIEAWKFQVTWVCWFPRVTMQSATNWVAQNNKNLLSLSTAGWKSEIKVLAGPRPLRRLQASILSCLIQGLAALASVLDLSSLTPISASVFTQPSSLCVWVFMEGSLLRVWVQIFPLTWISVMLEQGPP